MKRICTGVASIQAQRGQKKWPGRARSSISVRLDTSAGCHGRGVLSQVEFVFREANNQAELQKMELQPVQLIPQMLGKELGKAAEYWQQVRLWNDDDRTNGTRHVEKRKRCPLSAPRRATARAPRSNSGDQPA